MDGVLDLIIVGNDYSVRPSMGRYDASYRWCLLGDKLNGYKPLMPVQSGLKVNGDARRILPVIIHGKSYLVAAVNDESLLIFESSSSF